MSKAIIGGVILTPQGEVHGKALLYDEVIRGIVNLEEAQKADEVIDAKGLYVSPGLIDVHIHGYGGFDTSDGDADGVRKMASLLLQNGVTSFLPTTLTIAWERLSAICEMIRGLMQESASPDFPGAQIMGMHMEGPFVAPAYKGAQNPAYILEPDAKRILPYADVIRVLTLAPEVPGATECIRTLSEKTRIAVSIGHSGATFEQAMAARGAGATRVTHLFNAMSQLVHRAPGVVGAALVSDLYTELIADTFHVNRALFPLVTRAKGRKLVLVTDALRSAGMPDGVYENGGQKFVLKGIECRLEDGTIAGSVLKLNQAVKNLHDYGEVSLPEAVCAASLSAAESAGLQETKGSLEAGKDADIILMTEDCRVMQTIVRGVSKYRAEQSA